MYEGYEGYKRDQGALSADDTPPSKRPQRAAWRLPPLPRWALLALAIGPVVGLVVGAGGMAVVNRFLADPVAELRRQFRTAEARQVALDVEVAVRKNTHARLNAGHQQLAGAAVQAGGQLDA